MLSGECRGWLAGGSRGQTSRRVVSILFVVASLFATSRAYTESTPADPDPPSPRFVFAGFPGTGLYPEYVADPLRAQSALVPVAVLDSEIPETGDARFVLRLGGRFSLFRVHPAGQPNRGLQLDFKGGFFGHFDVDYSLDNIGWDGLYGLLLSWKPSDALTFRVGTIHDSAHVGDEYAERTGRVRIGYTREEWVAGASWGPGERWRAYAELGWASSVDGDQEPLRIQLGSEAFGSKRFWNERASWYAAADVTTYEERDFDTRLTIQAGIVIRTGREDQRYRLALEYVTGRSVLGEFTMHEESTLGLGWYFDF